MNRFNWMSIVISGSRYRAKDFDPKRSFNIRNKSRPLIVPSCFTTRTLSKGGSGPWKFSKGNYPSKKPSAVDKMAYNLLYVKIQEEERHKLAALYFQATQGPNKTPEPKDGSPSDIAYWKAWKQLGEMSKNEAEKKYVAEATRIFHREGHTLMGK